MSNKSDIQKLYFILEMIENIEEYIVDYNSLTIMLDNHKEYNATLMCFMQIGETLNKLVDSYKLLEAEDIKGAYDIRNFIAHDYEGIDKARIENIIRTKMPKLKDVIDNIIIEIGK